MPNTRFATESPNIQAQPIPNSLPKRNAPPDRFTCHSISEAFKASSTLPSFHPHYQVSPEFIASHRFLSPPFANTTHLFPFPEPAVPQALNSSSRRYHAPLNRPSLPPMAVINDPAPTPSSQHRLPSTSPTTRLNELPPSSPCGTY